MKKIGILGSGPVGQSLGNGFLKYGYEVMIGTRTASKLDDWLSKAGNKACVGSFAEVAAFGELLILCCKGTASMEVLKLAGEQNLKDKTIIDTTNPIADAPPENGVLKYFTSLDRSLIEQHQVVYANANFVKAFNSIGNALMVNPNFEGIKPTMFICGNNDDAKKETSAILDQFGFEVEDMGEVESGRAIEPLCILWCIPGFINNEWSSHAFKLLKK